MVKMYLGKSNVNVSQLMIYCRVNCGVWSSYKDTVVALQALAVYETHQHQGPTDVVVKVTSVGLLHTFSITESNKLLQQRVTLPNLPTSVSINMEGRGCALLQVRYFKWLYNLFIKNNMSFSVTVGKHNIFLPQAVLRYNVPVPESGNAFGLTVITQTEPDVACVTKRITVCAAYLLADGSSNMAVIEVNLVSGYLSENADLDRLIKERKSIKKYEVDGSLISFYIDELTVVETCLDFRIVRRVDVDTLKPGTVEVFDYYRPEFTLSKVMLFPVTRSKNIYSLL